MLTDIIVIDDVFDDPDFIVHKARGVKYYERHDHPEYIDGIGYANYCGMRSERLVNLDYKLTKKCNTNILDKIIINSFGYANSLVTYSFVNKLYFHYITSNYYFHESWFHRDNTLCAGIVYLNKNPLPNTGTILKKGNEETIIENKYNRLVLYNGGILHSPQKSFGNTVYDGRLTLTIFFEKLSFDMRYNNAHRFDSD